MGGVFEPIEYPSPAPLIVSSPTVTFIDNNEIKKIGIVLLEIA
jgi:hypothetical protein